jgi:hypothetical protein
MAVGLAAASRLSRISSMKYSWASRARAQQSACHSVSFPPRDLPEINVHCVAGLACSMLRYAVLHEDVTLPTPCSSADPRLSHFSASNVHLRCHGRDVSLLSPPGWGTGLGCNWRKHVLRLVRAVGDSRLALPVGFSRNRTSCDVFHNESRSRVIRGRDTAPAPLF